MATSRSALTFMLYTRYWLMPPAASGLSRAKIFVPPTCCTSPEKMHMGPTAWRREWLHYSTSIPCSSNHFFNPFSSAAIASASVRGRSSSNATPP